MSAIAPTSADRTLAFLNYLAILAATAVLALILGAAMFMQYAFNELPCPLCLLQRVCMLGVCYGMLMQFREGFSYRNTGIAVAFSLLLLIIAERQTLLDIYPRPGHSYVGSAIFGLHMPVWSIVISLVLLISFALKLVVMGGDRRLEDIPPSTFPWMMQVATVLGLIVIAICAINFGSVIVQCGLGECHTMGYALLGYTAPAS